MRIETFLQEYKLNVCGNFSNFRVPLKKMSKFRIISFGLFLIVFLFNSYYFWNNNFYKAIFSPYILFMLAIYFDNIKNKKEWNKLLRERDKEDISNLKKLLIDYNKYDKKGIEFIINEMFKYKKKYSLKEYLKRLISLKVIFIYLVFPKLNKIIMECIANEIFIKLLLLALIFFLSIFCIYSIIALIYTFDLEICNRLISNLEEIFKFEKDLN